MATQGGIILIIIGLLCSCSSPEPAYLKYRTSEPYDPIPGVPVIAKKPRKVYSTERKRSTYRGNVTYYKVRSGDSLWKIGQRFRVSWQKIQRVNGLRGTSIRAGQTLKIPR